MAKLVNYNIASFFDKRGHIFDSEYFIYPDGVITQIPNRDNVRCPSIYDIMDWLRDEKNIDIDIKACCGMLHIKVYVPCIHTYTEAEKLHDDDEKERWIQHDHYLRYEDDNSLLPAHRDFDTYEEAANAAIEYCLTKLLKRNV